MKSAISVVVDSGFQRRRYYAGIKIKHFRIYFSTIEVVLHQIDDGPTPAVECKLHESFHDLGGPPSEHRGAHYQVVI